MLGLRASAGEHVDMISYWLSYYWPTDTCTRHPQWVRAPTESGAGVNIRGRLHARRCGIGELIVLLTTIVDPGAARAD